MDTPLLKTMHHERRSEEEGRGTLSAPTEEFSLQYKVTRILSEFGFQRRNRYRNILCILIYLNIFFNRKENVKIK